MIGTPEVGVKCTRRDGNLREVLGTAPPMPIVSSYRGPSAARTMNCIFCKIVAGEIPSDRVYEDEFLLVFRDIQPQAPVHLLIVPRRHLESLDELEDADLAGRLLTAAGRVAREAGLERGWRLIANTGAEGGQEVPHLHLHVLGGRPLGRMLAAGD